MVSGAEHITPLRNELPHDCRSWMQFRAIYLRNSFDSKTVQLSVFVKDDAGYQTEYAIDVDFLKARLYDELYVLLPEKGDVMNSNLRHAIHKYDPVLGLDLWNRIVAISK